MFTAFFMPFWHPCLSVRHLVAIHILHDSVCHIVCDFTDFQSDEHLTLSLCSQNCVEESRHELRWERSYRIFSAAYFQSLVPHPTKWWIPWQQWRQMCFRHNLNFKTPTTQIHGDERNRPHICHLNLQPLILCHSLVYQQWTWVLILNVTVWGY